MTSRLRAALVPFIAIADLPGDDDDTRLRKRAGVVAGYFTMFAPLSAPAGVTAPAIDLPFALGLSLFTLCNLVALQRTRRFERYVAVLIGTGTVFVFATSILSGGVTTNSAGLVWEFLAPAFALLALGPRRATRWFLLFLATLAVAVAIDPLVHGLVAPPSYLVQVLFYLQNIGLPLTVTFFLLRYTDLRRRAAEARSDELLTNAIPAAIATRLRHGENRIAEAYPETTVVFTDIVGFTPWAGRTDPHRVVDLLDDLFSRFDKRAAELGVEKIKTVGDAYMAAAGAPQARADHAAAGLAFGQAILAEVEAWRMANAIDLQVRVGIASGRAVGGVIGTRRIVFDLWGDTVNTAARMESSGVAGRIQIAESTRTLLGDRSDFEVRQVDVKGLGPMTTYLLSEAAPAAG